MTIWKFEQIDNPDDGTNLFGCEGDYYAGIRIGSGDFWESNEISGNPDFGTGWIIEEPYTIYPNTWTYSRSFDSSSGHVGGGGLTAVTTFAR